MISLQPGVITIDNGRGEHIYFFITIERFAIHYKVITMHNTALYNRFTTTQHILPDYIWKDFNVEVIQ